MMEDAAEACGKKMIINFSTVLEGSYDFLQCFWMEKLAHPSRY